MNNLRELEQKWQVSKNPETYLSVLEQLNNLECLEDKNIKLINSHTQKIKLHNFYFDTLDRDLQKQKLAFRLRLENNEELKNKDLYITLKGKQREDGTRFEFEKKLETISPNIVSLNLYKLFSQERKNILLTLDEEIRRRADNYVDEHLEDLASLSELEKLILKNEDFKIQCWCSFLRTYTIFTFAYFNTRGSEEIFEVELAYDRGSGGNQFSSLDFSELELEFKKGESKYFYLLTKYLEDGLDLKIKYESKLETIFSFLKQAEVRERTLNKEDLYGNYML